jgi:hypothetical protein
MHFAGQDLAFDMYMILVRFLPYLPRLINLDDMARISPSSTMAAYHLYVNSTYSIMYEKVRP